MRLFRTGIGLVAALAVAGAALWVASAPELLSAEALPEHNPDAINGERIFHVAGCASCHSAPGAKGDDSLRLTGGLEMRSPFGVFRVPNITPDREDGIGGWSTLDFINAVVRGVSPDGRHYYPSMPYASYARMRVTDVIDLKAYLDTLPAATGRVPGHSIPFPFNIRRGLGLWKRMFVDDRPVVSLVDASEAAGNGQYLVEGPGHCGECHTSRNVLGALRADRWLAGAPNLEGDGRVPNITSHPDGIEDWSTEDIEFYFEAGITPDMEVVGGAMAAVQRELARLPAEDRAAIAAYLKAVPPLPDAVQSSEE